MKSMCGKFRPEKRTFESNQRGQLDSEKKKKRQKVESIELKPEVNQVRSEGGQYSDSSDD